MCFVCISEQRVNFALYIINRLVSIHEAESVYSAVRTESLYSTDTFRPKGIRFAVFMPRRSDIDKVPLER